MADLIAIGYPDTTTALQAEEEVQRLAQDLVIQPDAVAAIIRNEKGHIKTVTNHHPVGKGATWGLFWGFLFGLLFHPVLRHGHRRRRRGAYGECQQGRRR